ncbi:MAG: hypothetical protein ACP5UT_12370 [Bryobacteraceae bacterium]
MRRWLTAMVLVPASLCLGQPGPRGPATPAVLASAERVEIRGVVEKVEFAPGVGSPVLLVKDGGQTVRVQLGSMRYLMEHDFNPKAGSVVVVKGFRLGQEVVARTVELPEEKKSLELRTADGTPLWRMGRYGKKGR